MIVFEAFDTSYKLLRIINAYGQPSVEIINHKGSSYIKHIQEIIDDVYFDRDGTGESMFLTFQSSYSKDELNIMYEFIITLFTTH